MLSATAAATDGNNEFVDDMMLADQQAQMDAEQLDFEELELEDELEKEYYTTMPVQEGNGAVMSVAEELDFEESEWEDGLEKEFTTMPVQEDNGVVMPAVAEEDILTFDDFIMTVEDDVLPRGDAEDYEDVQDYATAVGGTQKEEQQQQEETNNNEEEGDKPNDVEAPRPEVEDNIAEESQQEEAQKDVVPRPELQDNIVQEDQRGESQPRGVDVDEEGEVASDSTQVEEIDVEEAAQDLLKEAEEEEETQKKTTIEPNNASTNFRKRNPGQRQPTTLSPILPQIGTAGPRSHRRPGLRTPPPDLDLLRLLPRRHPRLLDLPPRIDERNVLRPDLPVGGRGLRDHARHGRCGGGAHEGDASFGGIVVVDAGELSDGERIFEAAEGVCDGRRAR